jgi:hypothetical protein
MAKKKSAPVEEVVAVEEVLDDIDEVQDEEDLEFGVALDEDELVDGELDEDFVDEPIDEFGDDDALVDVIDGEEEEDDFPAPKVVVKDSDDDDDDDEDQLDPDDIEADLSVILKDRLASPDDDDDDEADDGTDDRSAETSDKIIAKRPGEFVCQSCFLVKSPMQRRNLKGQVDPNGKYCVDCV